VRLRGSLGCEVGGLVKFYYTQCFEHGLLKGFYSLIFNHALEI
jgi:hypothetical protein